MRNTIFLKAWGMLFIALVSCAKQEPTDLSKTRFIPLPVKVTATGASFEIKSSTTIFYQEDFEQLKQTGLYLASELNRIMALAPEVKATDEVPRNGIFLTLSEKDDGLTGQGYDLNIGKKRIDIKGKDEAGCFFAIQTLLQTLPIKAMDGEILEVPTGNIRDFPEYAYRGAMLDVARHFFGVDEVKRFIDYLTTYKMNHLHLHLSDDQGWRIEIKSWPKLTEIGGSTEVGGGEGGYYTQEQYSEIVRYAEERHITIIPEIDMPGHTNAALASYAELNCDGKATDLYTGIEVGFSTLCTDKEITYQFVDDVVGEIAALTPGPYFHIGGDESHVTEKEDYIYFVNRVQQIVRDHGKKIIGWDEIANATLTDEVTVQYWADIENTTMAVEQGAQVIMSPASKAYLDMQYDSTSLYGLHWAGYIPPDTAYMWNPATLVEGVNKENILGIEAPLWTETLSTLDEIEYMVFPRLPGLAEIGWTAPELRNWENYKERLAAHGKRFDAMGIDYYQSPRIPWEN